MPVPVSTLELCSVWQHTPVAASALIWSTTQWPGSLLFPGFQTSTVSLSQLLSAFAWGTCVPWVPVFQQFSSTRQDSSLQPRQSFPLLLFLLVLVQNYPACLEGNRRGEGQMFPAFLCRDLPWQIILVVLRQLFGVKKLCMEKNVPAVVQ